MTHISKAILFLCILIINIPFILMKEPKKQTSSPLKGIFSSDRSSVIGDVIDDFNEHIAVQKWRKNDALARKWCVAMYNKILPYVVNSSRDLDVSPSCSRALMKTLIGLKHYKLWAFQMIDASGKIPAGLLDVSGKSIGNYDECLNVNVSGLFRGQYCHVDVSQTSLPERQRFISPYIEIPEFENFSRSVSADSVTAYILKNLRFLYYGPGTTAVCVPSTCTREDVQKLANKVLQSLKINAEVVVPSCDILEEKIDFSGKEIIILIILGILLLLGITSTFVDVYLKLITEEENYQDNLSLPTKYLLCFSLYANTRRLIAPDTSMDTIKVFHGMRVITILWIILGHTYMLHIRRVSGFELKLFECYKDISCQVLLEALLSVDTFFFISAVVHSYAMMKLKDVKINYGFHILRRILRIGIPYMLVMVFSQLVPHLGSGPVWKATMEKKISRNCRSRWWTNLLFINNFIPYDDMCMAWSWYIAADTQLFCICLLVIIVMRRNVRFAFAMNLLLFLGGICISETVRAYYGLTLLPSHAYGNPQDWVYLQEMEHFRTYEHCSSCCVGLLVGYFLSRKSFKLKISLKVNLALWLSAMTLGLTVIFGTHSWNEGNVPNIILCILYKSTKRLWWSLALGWVTVSCMTGNGGIVNEFLSWPVVLARLTYMVYLVHPIVGYVYKGSTRTLIEADHRTLMYVYIGNVVVSYMTAFGCSLLFESPFMALQNLMFFSYMPDEVKRFNTSNCPKDGIEEERKMFLNDHEKTEEDSYARRIKIKENDNSILEYRKFLH